MWGVCARNGMQYTGKEMTMTGKWRSFGTINKVAKHVSKVVVGGH
jgi:hypothetical protein